VSASPTIAVSAAFVDAIHSRQAVTGYTHTLYRYPARFSPHVVRAAIEAFTEPGDLVVDPFMGGGTTAVEASAAGRRFVGTDTSRLAHFVSRAKSTPLSADGLRRVSEWVDAKVLGARLHQPANRPAEWIADGYLRNLDGQAVWRIRKLIELALPQLPLLAPREQRFARAILLGATQRAVDGRRVLPDTGLFRQIIATHAEAATRGMAEYAAAVGQALRIDARPRPTRIIARRSAAKVGALTAIRGHEAPRLIITSPPYPGIHVLYHRWQIHGGRETPAPFWIADVRDGDGGAAYTIASRHNTDAYFRRIEEIFKQLRSICDERTLLIQLVAFARPDAQLPRFLLSMAAAGFIEVVHGTGSSEDGRLRREVPQRRWYAHQRRDAGGAKEVVLFHRVARL
jgi:hypothetical protein